MKKYEFLNGTLHVADEVIVIEETIKNDTPYLGVVEVRGEDMPHIVFGSSKTISDLTEQEEAKILDCCCDAVPELNRIIEKEVDFAYDNSDHLTNAKSYHQSSHPLVFALDELNTKDQADIRIERGV